MLPLLPSLRVLGATRLDLTVDVFVVALIIIDTLGHGHIPIVDVNVNVPLLHALALEPRALTLKLIFLV